jgi:hypothetical protein
MVIGKILGSELLGVEQRVEQIKAEPDGHDQTKDRFNHCPPP